MIIFDEYIEYSDNCFCSYELQIFSFFTLIALSASSVLAIGSYDIYNSNLGLSLGACT